MEKGIVCLEYSVVCIAYGSEPVAHFKLVIYSADRSCVYIAINCDISAGKEFKPVPVARQITRTEINTSPHNHIFSLSCVFYLIYLPHNQICRLETTDHVIGETPSHLDRL